MKVTAQMRGEYFEAYKKLDSDGEIWKWYRHTKAEEQNSVDAIQSDRQNDYGDAGASFDNIAEMWTAYIKRKFGFDIFKPDEKLDRTDVAVMMMLLKASRLAFQRKHDSVLDMASYADFALKFTEK